MQLIVKATEVGPMIGDLSPDFPPASGRALGFRLWPHAACFSSLVLMANSTGGTLPSAECGRWLL